jgi:hypothetical protein
MITHQTKGMNTMAKALNPFLNKKIEPGPILIIEKNILPAIATQHDMVQSTGHMNSWFTRHA